MPFDPSALSPHARAAYIRLGWAYSSTDTLTQANEVLNALEKHTPHLAQHGFDATDAARLADARDALEAAGVHRTEQAGAKQRGRLAFTDAIQQAMDARATSSAVLAAVRTALRDTGAPEDPLRLATTTLSQTARLPREGIRAVGLHTQLELLLAAFADHHIAGAATARGGPATVAALTASITTLLAATRDRPARRGTPEETEFLDNQPRRPRADPPGGLDTSQGSRSADPERMSPAPSDPSPSSHPR
ncbi:hypothetical protein [Chondromyces apiculatus]|uniref:Uncharacterized protein n=1 Tax=Chondromyces apiculatus DSM 436 TaxID=1192034 RepID=A0A017T327_9BACT|nr:hypothetical protein [Chondromyces apiculatus]EYF03255.1 Hypothetical protein CAP_5759 [Chondromyces apiculatus DSM 436]